MHRLTLLSLLLLCGAAGAATPAPPDARAYIVYPTDGATVRNPVTVVFGLQNMGVAPAAEHYRHFGGGQTQTTLELSPGRHTLQLLLGDQNHVPHDPPVVSGRITIYVE